MQAKYAVLLRAVILEVLLLLRVYAPSDKIGTFWTWLLFPLYAAFALVLYRFHRRKNLPPTVDVAAFIGDIAFAAVIMNATGDVPNNL